MAAAGATAVLFSPATMSWHAPGTPSPGHERLACVECHADAPGSVRQQLQEKVRFALGRAARPTTFGALPVTNQSCTTCHERPADRHPVSRFLEPRFAEARLHAGVHRCTGCHLEHDGARVSAPPDVCRHCHGSLRLARDPLADSHATLVAREDWGSCLRCHDFHGNHDRQTPLTLERGLEPNHIADYFGAGDAPYGARRVSAR